MTNIYYLKERKLTENSNPKIIQLENDRLMEILKCASCGVKRLLNLQIIQYYIYDYLWY